MIWAALNFYENLKCARLFASSSTSIISSITKKWSIKYVYCYHIQFSINKETSTKLVKITLYTQALLVLAVSFSLHPFSMFFPVNNSLLLLLFHIPKSIWLESFSSIICFGNSLALGALTSLRFGFCQTVDSWLLSQMPSTLCNHVWQARRVMWYRKRLLPWTRQNSMETAVCNKLCDCLTQFKR